jgi:hypothetical protein
MQLSGTSHTAVTLQACGSKAAALHAEHMGRCPMQRHSQGGNVTSLVLSAAASHAAHCTTQGIALVAAPLAEQGPCSMHQVTPLTRPHSQGSHPAGSAACVVGCGPELPCLHIAMAGALPCWRVKAEAERCRKLRHRLVVCSATAGGFVNGCRALSGVA